MIVKPTLKEWLLFGQISHKMMKRLLKSIPHLRKCTRVQVIESEFTDLPIHHRQTCRTLMKYKVNVKSEKVICYFDIEIDVLYIAKG